MNHYWLGRDGEINAKALDQVNPWNKRPVLSSVIDFAYIEYPCTIHIYPSFSLRPEFKHVLDHLNGLKEISNRNEVRITVILHKFHYEPPNPVSTPVNFAAKLLEHFNQAGIAAYEKSVKESGEIKFDPSGYPAGLGETIRGIVVEPKP